MPRALLTLVVGFRPGDKPRVLLNLGVKKTEPQSWVIWRGTGGPTHRVQDAGEFVFVP